MSAVRPLRILMLSHAMRDPDAGAAGTSLRLAAALRAGGHEVIDLFKDDLLPARPASPIADDLITLAALRTVRGIRRERFDVVDATGFLGALLFPLLRATAGRRALLVARSYGLEHADHDALVHEVQVGRAQISRRYRLRGGGAHLRAVAWAIRRSDGFTCPRGADGQRALARGWKGSPRQVFVNGHGVTPEALTVDRDVDRPWEGRIVWCGTTVARKGWRDFATGVTRAWQMQTQTRRQTQMPPLMQTPALTVDVLGSGSSPREVLAHFPPEHRHRVTVHPRLQRAEQFAVMARADAFVSTSLSEGFHLALLEAMAIGLPCICTQAGFLLDEPRAAELALLLPARSPQHLADALRTLATDPVRRAGLARAGRELARTHTWAAAAERHIRWLGSLPSPHSHPATLV